MSVRLASAIVVLLLAVHPIAAQSPTESPTDASLPTATARLIPAFGVDYLLTPAEAQARGQGKRLVFAGQITLDADVLNVRGWDTHEKQHHHGEVVFSLPLASIQDVTPFTVRVQSNQTAIALQNLGNSLATLSHSRQEQVEAPTYNFWEYITVLAETPQGIETHTFHVRTGETATIVATIKFASKKAQGRVAVPAPSTDSPLAADPR